MILGPLTGLALHELPETSSAAGIASTTLDLITTGFLRLIKMIVGPLVFCTLTAGVARMEGAGSIARVGLRTVGWFLLATFIALIIGLVTERLFAPGTGMVPPQGAAVIATGGLHARDILEHVIPDSIIGALARNEILQIVVFS
jgi:Na+/H+-dicarboxylate symporter